MVSHGKAIRSGYSQRLECEPEDCRWIIQGLVKEDLKAPCPSLPRRLGIIKKKTGCNMPKADEPCVKIPESSTKSEEDLITF